MIKRELPRQALELGMSVMMNAQLELVPLVTKFGISENAEWKSTSILMKLVYCCPTCRFLPLIIFWLIFSIEILELF